MGSYVDPEISNSSKVFSSAKVNILQTDIMLVVSVPVLSEQMTEVQPRVSTDGRDRMMAFLAAILLVPRARQVVMTAGRPSGVAATARATAPLIQEPPWAGSLKWPMLIAHTAMQIRVITLESCSPNSSNFCCRGVLISSVATMASLILPMAVLAPVPITTPLALPEETLVPEKTMFFLSWLTALGSGTGSQCLITETDSPVRMDWSILRVVE